MASSQAAIRWCTVAAVITISLAAAVHSKAAPVFFYVPPQGNAVVAPQGLSYPTVAATYTQFLVITDNTPTLTHGGGKDDGVVFKVDGSSALPQGLSIAPATGTIFGTPEVTQARTTYTIVATNAAGSTSTNISIAVNPPIPPAFNYPLARVTMQQFIMLPSLQPTFVGSQPITFTSVELPPGLHVDATNGTIYGTPTQLFKLSQVTIVATNPFVGSAVATLLMEVTATAPQAFHYTPNNVTLPQFLSTRIVASLVATPPIKFTATPALPSGLQLSSDGSISGKPEQVLERTLYTITATNDVGSTTAQLRIAVKPIPPTTVSYSSSTINAVESYAITEDKMTVVATPPVTFAVTPELPSGLMLDKMTGDITGTPNATHPVAHYQVTASNPYGSKATVVTISVVAPTPPSDLSYPNTQLALPQFKAVSASSTTPTIKGTTPLEFTSTPALPAGLVLSSTTGSIHGAPLTLQAAASYTISASNHAGVTHATLQISVVASAPLDFHYDRSTIAAVAFARIAADEPALTGTPPFTYSVNPPLPAGLRMDNKTGIIQGTCNTVTKSSAHTVTVSNVKGHASTTVTIAVAAAAPHDFSYPHPAMTFFVGGDYTVALATNSTPSVIASPPLVFTVTPALPAGLHLNATTGEVVGMPTAVAANATYTVRVTNSAGHADAAITVEVKNTPNSGSPTSLAETFLIIGGICVGLFICAGCVYYVAREKPPAGSSAGMSMKLIPPVDVESHGRR